MGHSGTAERPLLRVMLFSSANFTYRGEPFVVERVQNRALLYRLAVELAPVARSELAFLFWPDVSDARAQRLLTQLLSHVRRALPDELLVSSKTHIQLDTQLVWSDAASFLVLCRGGKQAPVANLQQAVELYRGPLLEGLSLAEQPEYEVWLDGERARLERLYLESLDILIDRHVEQGQHAAAIETARRYLAVDELAEGVHRRQIDCYVAVGNRSAAIQQYEACVRILERELGVPPLPETTAAYQQALVTRAQPVVEEAQAPRWVALPGPDTPLVGREQTWQALAAHFAEVQNRRGRFVLLSGEAGIGKSRLMREFMHSIQGAALVLAATCRPGVQSIPYQPLVEALEPVLDRPGFLKRVPNVWLRQASALFPRLADTPGLPASQSSPAEPSLTTVGIGRSALFEALHQLMLGLATDATPLVLCLDDLQWADTTTIDWLNYLAAHIRVIPMLVCATYRSDERENVAGLLREISRLRVHTEYELSALDAGDVLQILEHLQVAQTTGQRSSQATALAARLREVSGGNPFFLLETVQGLRETNQLAGGSISVDSLPLSQSVRGAIRSRLARLQPLARQVLEAAAVLGASVGFEAVQQTAGRSEFETLDGMEELIGRHLLVEDRDSFRFNHELTRSVAYRELDDWRRCVLHRRAAEILEGRLRGIDRSERAVLVAEIGRHYLEAQESGRAVDYLVEAGDYARNLYHHAPALELYEQALAILRRQGNQTRTARTLMKIGLTYHTEFAYDKAWTAFDEGFEAYRRARLAGAANQLATTDQPLRLVSPFPGPHTWDPAEVNDFQSYILLPQLFSGLLSTGAELDIVPELAERWEVLHDGREYIMHLIAEARWSDGAPLTAHDFIYAWRRMLNPKVNSPSASRLYAIRGARAYHDGQSSDPATVGVRALDEHTLSIELEEPTGHFLHLLTLATYAPAPRHVLDQLDGAWMSAAPFVTNGPYMLQTWDPAAAIVLRRNPYYHGVFGGNVQEVHYFSCSDWGAKLRMYEQGEIDVLCLRHPPTLAMDKVRRRFETEYVTHPMLWTDSVGFDTERPPFRDARVRQALAYAIDKETLAGVTLRNYVSPAGGFVPPNMPGHIARAVLPYNPQRARHLLAEAGYPEGRGFPAVEWLVAAPAYTAVADYLREQWQRILQIDIPYQAVSWETLFSRISAAPLPLFVLGWAGDYPDPDTFLGDGPIQINCNYRDEMFDWLLDQARTSLNQVQRIAACEQLDRMVCEEAVVAPLYYSRTSMLVKPWVKAFPFSPMVLWCWKDVVLDP